MHRYLVTRTFPDGLRIPAGADGRAAMAGIVGNNTDDLVTWLHSYVSADRRRTYCVYDGPSPEAVRRAAQRNGLPVDAITEVSVLDPYFSTAS
jgi:hypothetical protein